ncbi:MAG: hypothetical protein ACLUE1_01250 [Adlercreutzia equolifaciens]
MGMNQDPRGDAYGRSPERPDAPAPAGRAPQGSRGKITTRPSRESILQSYATQDEMRARDARLRSQQASRAYTASAAQRDADRAARREALAAQQREQGSSRRPAAAPPRRLRPSAPASANPRGAPLSSQEATTSLALPWKATACPRLPRCPFRGSPGPRSTARSSTAAAASIAHLQREPPDFRLLRDDRDRHTDDRHDGQSWYSRAGQGFATPAEAPGAPAPVRRPVALAPPTWGLPAL